MIRFKDFEANVPHLSVELSEAGNLFIEYRYAQGLGMGFIVEMNIEEVEDFYITADGKSIVRKRNIDEEGLDALFSSIGANFTCSDLKKRIDKEIAKIWG